jgi:hypothetical protein
MDLALAQPKMGIRRDFRVVATLDGRGGRINGCDRGDNQRLLSHKKHRRYSRIPLQEAEFAIMQARLVFGALAALVVVSFMASGVLALGELTVLRVLTVAIVSGFSERLVFKAVNSFAGKERS